MGFGEIRCLSENLILFRPKSKKVRVRVWRELDKREVNAFLCLIYGGIRDCERKKESLVKGKKKPPSEVVVVMKIILADLGFC